MSESMARQFGKFLGGYLEYDTKFSLVEARRFMRVKVKLDVQSPLKHKKKIHIGLTRSFYATFQYEKLSLLCFLCGKLGHGESFCPLRVRINPKKVVFGKDISLRALTRRKSPAVSK